MRDVMTAPIITNIRTWVQPYGVFMATASRNPLNSLDERLFPPIQVLERPVGERPQHETLEGIMDWLADPARQVGVPSLIGEFDEFAWRMLPAASATLQLRTLHPQ